MLVISLATADALNGVMLFQYHLSQNVCPLAHWVAQHRAVCLAKFVGAVFVGMASINSLAAIGYDRYLCIVHSLRYQHIMTTRRAWVLIGLVWSVSAAGSATLLLGNRWQPPETPCVDASLLQKGILLLVIVPVNMTDLAIIAVTHIYIRREVGRSVAMLPLMPDAGRPARLSGDSATSSTSTSTRGASSPPPDRRLSAGTIKSAQVLLLVVGCYVLAFTPVLVVMLLRLAGVGGEHEMEWAFRFGYTVAGLHNVVNPFIYAWKNKPLKADVVRLWSALRGRGSLSRAAAW
ncbi:alpha-1D adrenergic receptor-like [Thrips palmi]|uniref:Alpha-1D adrenergic receptor-like n=1 Tax=Thrips palmi TaxID=161013 RepID=A0A6P9A707_THRPL|nr:alpha-1D adrenergic receptor-like [Thrips palmi]